jgi:PAS domain-containing protein
VGHKSIELILLRQFASRLHMPVSIADAQGCLVYINPPVERLLGFDFAGLDGYPISRFGELLDPRWPDGSVMKAEEMTLAVALHERRPQQGKMILHGKDGVGHLVVTNAVPLDGQGGKLLGSMSIFWEAEDGVAAP